MKIILINIIRKSISYALKVLKPKQSEGREKRGNPAFSFKPEFKLPQKKDTLGQRRSHSKAKGSVNTDTRIFNKPRKEESQGRQN